MNSNFAQALGGDWRPGDTFARLKKIILEELEVEEGEIDMTASFVVDLRADSLELVEIMMRVEEEFGIMIREEEAERIITVGDAVDFINDHT